MSLEGSEDKQDSQRSYPQDSRGESGIIEGQDSRGRNDEEVHTTREMLQQEKMSVEGDDTDDISDLEGGDPHKSTREDF